MNVNDGTKRCAHGFAQTALQSLEPGYAFDVALGCELCQKDTTFTPMRYRIEPAALEAPVPDEDLPPLIPFPVETDAAHGSCLAAAMDAKFGLTSDKVDGLPTDREARKRRPICSGVLDYFPDAIAEVAFTSWVGNEQHNPGEPLHWARGKSMDQEDALLRHLMERGKVDTDGVRHSGKVAWRALALLQLEIEAARGGA